MRSLSKLNYFSITVVLAIALAAIVLTRSLVAASSDEHIVSAVASTVPITITDTETLLIAPRAHNIQDSPRDERSPWRRISNFIVPNTVDEVAAYYASELARRGWTTIREQKGDDWKTLSFYWTDPNVARPWHPDLTISLKSISNEAAVSMWYERTPDMANIPEIPDSKQLTSTVTKDKLNVPEYRRVYQTDYTPLEVIAFYKEWMTEYGWLVFDHSGGQDHILNFWFDRSGGEITRAGEASVKAYIKDGITIVEMFAR